ncbi:hypothetical protein A3A70_00450 [candidate division WWE3 bacterium RIFCSPLOWO2_01_FULL_42_11]|uniref:Vitamin K epoxide reductase domain-containing protein n=1 Tax=candidate division WWE3 bacterium RIFCSPLOWO2_01_FULL_42_11 TaxID=1802627 RepID=A0A1F4VMJ7_UNCKA|nr:MAG: hypothetical protein A3A70_00450 [candidate division WWE3 bacterium RIFCSPLOWO2_01_FULL_42_11]
MDIRSKTILQLILSFIGLADSSYLTVISFTQGNVPCVAGLACEKVLNSAFSHVGVIPIALIGAIYYLILSLLFLGYLDRTHSKYLSWAFKLIILGTLAEVGLVSLQLFVIKAICPFCMISAIVTFLIAGLFLISKRSLIQ